MTDAINDVSIQKVDDLKSGKNAGRLENLQNVFKQQFGQEPAFIVNVPGRVNLIGEHVDYCGYPVLPMAIEQSILCAVSPTEDCQLHITNANEKYKPFKCPVHEFEIQVPEKGGSPDWHNYFLCGVKGIQEKLPADAKLLGMNVVVSGNVPPASGLSSSSALVSAATLATSYVNNFTLNKETLANISANCERYIGTQGGGMDQAIAFLAVKGCAQFIEWNPLTATPTSLPPNAFFVIANSLSKANKAATSDFNQRVIECRLACRFIAKKLNLDWRNLERFASLQKAINCDLNEFERIADSHLTAEIYSRQELIAALEVTEEEFENDLLTPNTRHAEKFKLRQRALHVIQESIRVLQFRKAAVQSDSVPELSKLMRESHRSLKELYECSHPNLDRLVAISDEFGVGARLTGAGWGGCIVALCNSLERGLEYIEELKTKYYKDVPEFNEAEVDNIVFVTSPQRGAGIYLYNV